MKKCRLILKRLSVLALVAMFLLVSVPVGADESKTISLWGWQGELEDAWLNHLIPDFEAANPGVKVELILLPWDQYWQKVQTAMVSDSLPDLLIMSVAYVDSYAASGALINLKPYIERDIDRSLYFEAGVKTTRYPDVETGDEYAFPWNMVCNTLYYNTTLFDNAGIPYPTEDWTWDDMRQAALKLTNITDSMETTVYGFGVGAGYESIDSIIYANGGALVSDDLSTAVINSPENIATLQFLKDLIYEDKVSPELGQIGAGSILSFATGQVAMEIGGAWALEAYASNNKFDWDIVPLPKGSTGERFIRSWSDSIAISKDSNYPDEAWEFIKFFVGPKGQTIENLTSTRIPILISATVDPAWLQPGSVPKHKNYLADYLDESSPLIFRGGWNEWNTIAFNEFFLALTNEKAIDQALSDAQTGIQGVLDEYNAK